MLVDNRLGTGSHPGPSRVPDPWHIDSLPSHHKGFNWSGGSFEMAYRTESVEGTIKSSRPLVMATLSGGARRHEFVTDDCLRYADADQAGFVSFLRAGCERRSSSRTSPGNSDNVR